MLRLAADLEGHAVPESCQWVNFFVARARALVQHGKGQRAAGLAVELDRLAAESRRLGLSASLPAIEAARAVVEAAPTGY